MLSGNGRHRRPRQAPALLVAAGVTGSALAIPLLAATGASAASGTTWDRVAECESGGFWSADAGNGFYGGLQLPQADWEMYGGLTYAPSADQASRSQQIAVAENLLADQGAEAWEGCALLSGLDKDTSPADVDTGVVEEEDGTSSSSPAASSPASSPASSSSSTSTSTSSSSTSASRAPSVSAPADSVPSVGSESSGSSKSSESVTPPSASPSPSPSLPAASQEGDSSSTGAAKGEEAGNSGQNVGSGVGESEGEVSSGTGRHRGEAEGSYTVRLGDTLCGIADSLGLEDGWSELYAENEDLLGADPNHILPGQTLEVGDEPGQK